MEDIYKVLFIRNASKEKLTIFAVIICMIQVKLRLMFNDDYINSGTLLLTLGKDSTKLLPTICWNVLLIGSFVYDIFYIVSLVQSLALRVPIILMICVTHLYLLSKWVGEASRFTIICYSFKMNGILFASIGALGFILLFVVLVMLVHFLPCRSLSKVEE